MSVATGCGFKEIYRFPHTTFTVLFAAASLLFCSFLKMFLVLVPVLFLVVPSFKTKLYS